MIGSRALGVSEIGSYSKTKAMESAVGRGFGALGDSHAVRERHGSKVPPISQHPAVAIGSNPATRVGRSSHSRLNVATER